QANVFEDVGRVTQVRGNLIKGIIPGACLGSICIIKPVYGKKSFYAEVVGFENRDVLLMPLTQMQGVGLGSSITLFRMRAHVPVGEKLLGRVINAMGHPIDELGPLKVTDDMELYSDPKNPMLRKPIREPLSLGIRAIDGLITVGQGQRVGILAGSGVGKSVLLGMMAENTTADINVIALIGERGREVRDFIENSLGKEGLKRSIVVVANSDESPLVRMRGAFVATSIAEYFSNKGKNVLLMMDSVTRFAMAQREIGLSIGEPPATKGYTPSVFTLLPKLLERAGSFKKGSITGLYTVLVEGDDMDDPIADSVRSIVDGHIVLSRRIAERGRYPAVDVLKSNSRVMQAVASREHVAAALDIRKNMAYYNDAEDLINIGAYKEGANPKIDRAVRLNEAIELLLTQHVGQSSNFEEAVNSVRMISEQL
ncbi:MAG: FliI/YscN family ATPase, partial [Bdellovibrionales bacterium]|nr:FliI/YscN family ATPase [Bdellovibrionales bacterium]